jgi:hypothetical protein
MNKVKYERLKAHQRYKGLDGTVYPGATTVLGVKNKPALLHWAWKQGQAGLDLKKVQQEAFDIGSCAHFMLECHVKGLEPDLGAFAADDVDKATNAYLKWLDWWQGGGFTLLHSELQLVSPDHKYGGTLDLVVKDAEGRHVLVDYKTSKAIYGEYKAQVAAYAKLYDAGRVQMIDGKPTHRMPPGGCISRWIIVRIGKEETGDFEARELKESEVEDYWNEFKACLDLHMVSQANERKWK